MATHGGGAGDTVPIIHMVGGAMLHTTAILTTVDITEVIGDMVEAIGPATTMATGMDITMAEAIILAM